MSAEEPTRWRVGQLAEATGVTVRSLHHYDEIGLLVPSERTTGGHRLYGEADVQRLYRILALRRLGFALSEIETVLDADRPGKESEKYRSPNPVIDGGRIGGMDLGDWFEDRAVYIVRHTPQVGDRGLADVDGLVSLSELHQLAYRHPGA